LLLFQIRLVATLPRWDLRGRKVFPGVSRVYLLGSAILKNCAFSTIFSLREVRAKGIWLQPCSVAPWRLRAFALNSRRRVRGEGFVVKPFLSQHTRPDREQKLT
jgi:hypothetical protein